MDTGCWKPSKASHNGPCIYHLFFADDLMLFVDNSCEQMKVINECLDEFVKASGQKTNLAKSKHFFSPKFAREEAMKISEEARIPMTDNLERYLGTQLVHQRYGKEGYTQLLDKYRKRMDGRKLKMLSLAGRITSAKSVVTSVLVFQMQTAQLPCSVLKETDRMVRQCIWGNMNGQRNMHLVS